MPKNINWKAVILSFAAISAIFFFAFFYSAFDSVFPVRHQEAIAGNSNWPETYFVSISPALAFAKTWGFARVFGIILWIVLFIYMVAVGNDLTGKFLTKNFVLIYFLLTVAIGAFLFAGHSNKLGTTPIPVTPEKYELIKDSKTDLGDLFD